MTKILIVEDNQDFNKAVSTFLSQYGHEVFSAFNANDAYDTLYENQIDLIISDIMMPGADGFEFASAVRETNKEIPILFVTAKDDLMSKRMGYGMGIDDYMVKPIDLDELNLRIGALLRRARIAVSKKVVIGKLVLDAEEHSAYYDGEEIQLTLREFNIIFKMLSYPKKAFSRSKLMDEFWDADTTSSTRTVDVYMTKLREKFSCCEEFEIITVHGLGYKVVLR